MSPSNWPESWTLRSEEILHSVYAGEFDPIVWCQVYSDIPGHDAIFYVSADALSIDGVRLATSAALAQQIVDALRCTLSTSRLEDLSWDQCEIYLHPETQPDPMVLGQPPPDSLEANLLHSRAIDVALGGRTGFVRTVGKPWILSNVLATRRSPRGACAYGWHRMGKPRPIVERERHLGDHSYERTICPVRGECMVDGKFMQTTTVMQTPELAGLLSYEGPLHFVRQPDVPYISNTLPSPPPLEVDEEDPRTGAR